jgi:hypothetical protein
MIHIEHNANDLCQDIIWTNLKQKKSIFSKLKGKFFIVKSWIILQEFKFANKNDSKFKWIFPMKMWVYEISWNFEARLFENEKSKNQIFDINFFENPI